MLEAQQLAVMHMNKKLKITLGSLVGLVVLIFVWLWARPTIPKTWEDITPGMSRSEVLKKIPNLNTNIFEIKGIDSAYALQ